MSTASVTAAFPNAASTENIISAVLRLLLLIR